MIDSENRVLTAPDWAPLRLRGTGGMTVDFAVRGCGWPAADEECQLFVHAHAPGFTAMYDWRPVIGGDLTQLGEWLDRVVTHEAPEMSVPALSLPRPGIVMDIVASDSAGVTVEFVSLMYPDDPDGFSFDTTLLALRHAATQITSGGYDGFPRTARLFSGPHREMYQSLIWRSVELPEGSQLNGVSLTDEDRLEPPGKMAMLRGLAFDPDCDAQLELDRLRAYTPGAVATLLGTLPNGDRFGVLVLQSTEEMDDEFTSEWSGDEPLGVDGGPGADPLRWWHDATDDDLADLQEFYDLEFNEAAGWAEEDAPFAECVGSCWLPYVDIAGHLNGVYGDRSLLYALSAGTAPPLRTVLRRLLGEAVGVPLDRMLATDGCVLPDWDHSCRYEAVEDALAAWMERLVAPEQFTEFLVKDKAASGLADPIVAHQSEWLRATKQSRAASTSQGSAAGCGDGGYALRFTAILGPRSTAPAVVRDLFDFADETDQAMSDRGELDALKRAWQAAEQLLVHGVPDSHEDRVRDLAEQLGKIFRDFKEE